METFSCYWPFVRGINRWPVNSPPKGQWRETLMFSLICAWTNCWINNRDAGDLRRYRVHYDVIVMKIDSAQSCSSFQWLWITFVGRVTSFTTANGISRDNLIAHRWLTEQNLTSMIRRVIKLVDTLSLGSNSNLLTIGLFATSRNMDECKACWEAWSPTKPFPRQEIWV